MVVLDKMMIQGIRNFGPEDGDQQVIKFFSPLTLILGQNGCGKTTIIESLKYAVTGDVPPGCKSGQSFVHDPKIARQPETRGQVKLKVKSMKGDLVVVTRSMQTTQKAKKMEFKTLDSTIQKTTEGKTVQTSSRCLDVDAEMCRIFGVSKPVLNNVIFCHQEESNWPMEEGKKLKERFDSIFDATKHNKCLENIRHVRKKVLDKIKLDEGVLVEQKKIKEVTETKQNELRDAERKIGVNRDQIQSFEEKLEPIVNKLEEIHAFECDYSKLHIEKETKKNKVTSLQEQQAELRMKISKEFVGSFEELQAEINSFSNKINSWENNILQNERELKKITLEEERLLDEISQEQLTLGKLQQELDNHNEEIEIRDKNLKDLANNLGLSAVTDSLSSEIMVSTAIDQVARKVKNLSSDFKKLCSDTEKEEQLLQGELDIFRDNKVKLEQEITIKSQQQKEYRSEARKVSKEIEEGKKSAELLIQLEKELEEAKELLEETSNSVNLDDLKIELNGNKERQGILNRKLDDVNSEIRTLQLQSAAQAELEIHRKTKALKENEARKLRNKLDDSLCHLLHQVPDFGIKEAFDSCIAQMEREITDCNSKILIKQREISGLEADRIHLRNNLVEKETELKRCEELIYDNCDGRQDFDEFSKIVCEKVQELQDVKGTLKASEYLFRRYVQKLQQREPCCPLCHRDFEEEAEAQELVIELNNKLKLLPDQLVENKRELELKQKQYDQLLQLKPTRESITKLQNIEIPALRKLLLDTESKLESLHREVSDLQNNILGPKADEKMARTIQNDVLKMDQLQVDLRKIERELNQIEAKFSSGASLRTLKEALNEQENLRDSLNICRRDADKLQKQISDHQDKIQQLREHKNHLSEKHLKLQSGIHNKRMLEERLAELEGMDAISCEELQDLEKQLVSVRKSLDQAVKNKNDTKMKNQNKLETERLKVNTFETKLEDIKNRHICIQKFKGRGIMAKLDNVRKSLVTLENTRMSSSEKKTCLLREVDDIKNNLSKQEVQKRELEDCLKIRQKEQEINLLVSQIDELTNKIGGLNIRTILTEKDSLLKQKEKLTEEKAQAQGRLRELQDQVSSLKRELMKDTHKNAEKKYKETLRRIKVQKAGADDLDRYYIAMDKALIYVHKERMITINRIIRELWRRIYRGNDIDYIEIKTDEPEITSADKRRNFNYRVVQSKNSVEVDMRGRCSAGQKVLASLIIRIALAETLSLNCGILALDEPTTNLDRDNVNSLSEALTEIVNSRRENKNFQLILITHDDEFLQRLTNVEKLNFYHRVFRNPKGNSRIEKHTITS